MKSKLPIKLSSDFEIIIEKGNRVKAGDKIATRKKNKAEEKIPISHILSIKPSDIAKYLTRRVGARVKKGEIIAKKDSFVKTLRILSPHDATIASIDLKKGIISLESGEEMEEFEYAPIEGVIENILDGEVIFSVEGDVITGSKGQGETIYGDTLISLKHLDMFDFANEVKGKIIVAPEFTEGALAKLLALDAGGVVTTKFYSDFPVIVSVEPDLFHKILTIKPKKLVLLGEKKSIIIPS